LIDSYLNQKLKKPRVNHKEDLVVKEVDSEVDAMVAVVETSLEEGVTLTEEAEEVTSIEEVTLTEEAVTLTEEVEISEEEDK
jgi:hypothetical protein